MKLNIIRGNKYERHQRLETELRLCGISNYEYWEGIYLPSIKASINAAHKQIVEYAKLANWPEVAIAEDDFKATHPESWKYFLSRKPDDFDIYLSSVFLGDLDKENCVNSFTGLTLYVVNRRFYDIFLDADPNEHLDVALAGQGRYVVCNPFTFIQYDGISGNTGKWENYGQFFKNRPIFVG